MKKMDVAPFEINYQKWAKEMKNAQLEKLQKNNFGIGTEARCRYRAAKGLLKTVLLLEKGDSKAALEMVKESLVYLCVAAHTPL